MSTAKFKQYQHGVAPYAQRCKPDVWQKHKSLLTTLHEQRVPRRLMLEALNEEGFHPSMGQLVSKLRQWNFMVLGQRSNNLQTVQSLPVEGSNAVQPLHRQYQILTGLEESNDSSILLPDSDSLLQIPQPCHLPSPTDPLEKQYNLQNAEHSPTSNSKSTDGELCESPITNTWSIADLPDLPELVDVESDVVSGSPDTASDIGDYFKSSKAPHDDLHVVADPYASPNDVMHEQDPLFGFHYDFCDTDFQRNSSYKQPTRPNQSSLISRTHYCCLGFFTNGAVGKSPSALYWHLLDECQSTRSLKYALSLIFIWGTSSPYSLQNNIKYRNLIQSAAEHYLPLATRDSVRNEYLDHISARIAGIYSSLFDQTFFLDKDGSPKVLHHSRGLAALSLEERRSDLLSYAQSPPGDVLREPISVGSEDAVIMSVALAARRVLLSRTKVILGRAMEVDALVSRGYVGENGTRLLNDSAWTLASKISALLLHDETFQRDGNTLSGTKCFSLDVVSEAIGLVVADHFYQEPHESATSVHDQERAMISALHRLPERDTLSARKECLTSLKMRIGSVEACRLCDSIRTTPDRERSWIDSLRPCRADTLCRLLDSDIVVFDKELNLTDASGSSIDRARKPTLDTISIRTTSSSFSISKLKDIANQIYLRSNTSSILSALSIWSGHVSSKSWQLESAMQVEEIPLESIYTQEDREEMDQRAYERIQDTELS